MLALLDEALLSSKISSQAENHLLMPLILHGEKILSLLALSSFVLVVPKAFFLCIYFSF